MVDIENAAGHSWAKFSEFNCSIMKFIPGLFWVALAALSVVSGAAADTQTNATPVSTLAPIEFLVGGTWHGDLASATNEPKMAIESKFEWTGNHQGIRFDSTWVINGKGFPYSSGIYMWNPEKKQIAIVYNDAKGALTEGFVEFAGPVLLHNLREVDISGKVEMVQAKMTHLDAQTFVNEIYTLTQGHWQKIVSVRYARMP